MQKKIIAFFILLLPMSYAAPDLAGILAQLEDYIFQTRPLCAQEGEIPYYDRQCCDGLEERGSFGRIICARPQPLAEATTETPAEQTETCYDDSYCRYLYGENSKCGANGCYSSPLAQTPVYQQPLPDTPAEKKEASDYQQSSPVLMDENVAAEQPAFEIQRVSSVSGCQPNIPAWVYYADYYLYDSGFLNLYKKLCEFRQKRIGNAMTEEEIEFKERIAQNIYPFNYQFGIDSYVPGIEDRSSPIQRLIDINSNKRPYALENSQEL